MRALFAVLSIVLAGVVLTSLYREATPPWAVYQDAYRRHLRAQGRNDAVPAGVRQDWLPELRRADRCRTCHIGVDDPQAPPGQPLAAHPAMAAHEFSRFGCTVCHGGNGPATRLPDAHEGLVPKPLVESSCVKCHDTAVLATSAPTAAAGLALVETLNCRGCHRFAGRGKKTFSGPDLTGLGVKVELPWLLAWLRGPRRYLPEAKMGDFLLTSREAADLAAYLLAARPDFDTAAFLRGDKALAKMAAAMDDDAYDALLAKGKTLFGRMRCLSCHRLNGKGGVLGPDLTRLPEKTDRAWVRAWLRDPHAYDTHTVMPAFVMSGEERLAVTAFLWDEALAAADEADEDSADGDAVPAAETAGEAGLAGRPETGARLFVERGCYNCHYLPGIEGPDDFAPSLAELAGLTLEKIVFGPAPVPHTRADYVTAKIQSPRVFGPNLKMPWFGLSPRRAGLAATAVAGMSEAVPRALRPREERVPVELPAGEAGAVFSRYRCLTCHRIGGRGGTLAPDLTAEGSKVNEGWLRRFLQTPYAIRPFLRERMPRFNMPEEEAVLLAGYFAMARRDGDIDRREAVVGDAARGRFLYQRVFLCQSCHTIGDSGGYYGPALDGVGARLRPAWLALRLLDSHAHETWAREPKRTMTPEQRRDLLAYLLTLDGPNSGGRP